MSVNVLDNHVRRLSVEVQSLLNMPLLSSEEACEVAGAFLFTLYGSQTFSRWKELKSRMSFITEKEYVDWLLDVANHYEQEGVLERFKYEESPEKSTKKVKLISTSSVPLLTSREACFGADAFLFTLYGGRTFSRWKEVKLRMNFHNEKEYVDCLLNTANHYEHPDAVCQLKKSDNKNAGRLKSCRRDVEVLLQTGEPEDDNKEISSSEDPASDKEDEDYRPSDDTIKNTVTSSADVKSRRQKQFICKYCKYKSVLRLDCVRHIRSSHEQFKFFPCPHCKKKMGRKDNLKQHVVNMHKDATTYDCRWCHSNDMHTLTEYLIHISKCESKPTPPATNGIQRENKIDQDEEVALGKKFTCNHCAYSSNSKRDCKRHVNSIHEHLNPFPCSHCSHKATRTEHLRTHMTRIHQDATEYKCCWCATCISTIDDYITHVRNCKSKFAAKDPDGKEHTNTRTATVAKVKPPKPKPIPKPRPTLKCDYCEKEFIGKIYVNRHVARVHKEMKSCVCDKCGMKFTCIKDLRRHSQSVHEHLRPYLCEHCPYQAARKDNLIQHMVHRHKHHTPYMCYHCGKFLHAPKQYHAHVLRCKSKTESTPEMKNINLNYLWQ